MSWVRLDDTFGHHPKVVSLSDRAFRVHVLALCYASQHETDGFIPAGVLPVILGSKRTAAELEAAGLWEQTAGGWVIHDYLLYNPSRAELDDERKRRSERAGAAASARWSRRPREAGEPPPAAAAAAPQQAQDQQPPASPADAPRMPDGMPTACPAHAAAHARRMPDGMLDACSEHAEGDAQPMLEGCSSDATSPIRPLICDDSSLRSSSSHPARKARDDDLKSLPERSPAAAAGALEEAPGGPSAADPPAVREVRDLVLAALPRKFQADPLTFDEAAQLGRDFAGAHEAVAAAIAECRRRSQLPFPSRVRAILQEVQHANAQGRPWGADDPILAQLRAAGALVE